MNAFLIRTAARTGLLFASLLAFPLVGAAQQLTRDQSDFFENKVRPILVKNCYKCHSQQAPKLKAGLSLETREGWAKGGDNGPAIVPGDPEKSMLIKAVRYKDEDLQMPPKGDKLSDSDIATLETWVRMGAPDPRTGAVATNKGKSARDHWAFQPVKQQPVPDVADPWVQSPVDAFVFAKLKDNGMKPNPVADKRTLIRRATFDLIGLPPSQDEIKDFLVDNSPDAFAKVVDRLLASPHYGERWGRYWLDTARYSDTKGDVKKNQEDAHYPFAWVYRDYVIRSFNQDKPYNKFVVEQIAADKLPASQTDRTILAAMGFLTLGERFNENPNDIINDRIDVVTKGFLGLTVTCARCHDHKFDPIPTKDYYSLHGIFASSVEPLREPIISKIDIHSPAYGVYQRKASELETKISSLTGQRRGNRGNPMVFKQLTQELNQTREELAQLDMTNSAAPMRAMVLEDRPVPADSPVFIRGEAENKGDIVPREFLQILSPPNRVPYKNGSGRLELAASIVNPNNPLTARVIVNRVWLHHFDAGIVTTPDDFGNQSAPPSHPELLDYLASRFIADGWSLKKLHRVIMLSSTYQESSANNADYAQKDPQNRLLWRANIRRMEFEVVRDSLLAIGGKLDETIGGRPVTLGAYPYSMRRTVYGFVDRHDLPELYNQFDYANPDITTGKRYETVVPQQSLFLMNSPLVMEQARNLVGRSDFQAQENAEDRVKLLYELVYQRDPGPQEIQLGLRFVRASPENDTVPRMGGAAQPQGNGQRRGAQRGNQIRANRLEGTFAAVPPGERKPLSPWEKYAHALLQANEAIFIN